MKKYVLFNQDTDKVFTLTIDKYLKDINIIDSSGDAMCTIERS